MVFGNDVQPTNMTELSIATILVLFGTVVQATIIGNAVVIMQSLSRKGQQFFEKIQVALTSMKNMHLPKGIQQDTIDFLSKTQSHLDNKNELDAFMKILSPSLKTAVQGFIFRSAIVANRIFHQQDDIVTFLVTHVEPIVLLPEDQIIKQGDNDRMMYFVSTGQCEVTVFN